MTSILGKNQENRKLWGVPRRFDESQLKNSPKHAVHEKLLKKNSFCPTFGLDVKKSDFVAIQKIKQSCSKDKDESD